MAGYADPEQSGFANRKNVVLRARVDEELRARALSGDVVIDRISQIALDPTQHPDHALKALELLGKAHGLFTDKVDVSGGMTSTVRIVGVSADDI